MERVLYSGGDANHPEDVLYTHLAALYSVPGIQLDLFHYSVTLLKMLYHISALPMASFKSVYQGVGYVSLRWHNERLVCVIYSEAYPYNVTPLRFSMSTSTTPYGPRTWFNTHNPAKAAAFITKACGAF